MSEIAPTSGPFEMNETKMDQEAAILENPYTNQILGIWQKWLENGKECVPFFTFIFHRDVLLTWHPCDSALQPRNREIQNLS